MNTLKIVRLMGLTTVLAAAPALLAVAAHAQSPAPAPAAPGQVKPVPPVTDMDADLPRAGGGGASPSAAPSGDSKVSPPAATLPGKSAGSGASATVKDVTIGTAVFGSDGQKIGEIKGVKSEPGGAIEEIHVKTGGLLGFGGKVVVIPGSKIAKGGQTVQVAMTVDEVGKLPALAEKKS